MSKKDDKSSKKSKVHKDLDGLNVEIDDFGKIKTNINIDEINKFLDKNVEDKKLKDRDDLES